VPWLRIGDNAATNPIVLRVAELVAASRKSVVERDVAVNEVFGFVARCATQSAGHTTDYVVSYGTALTIGGNRTDRLLTLAVKAGYLTRVDAQKTWRLLDDPTFIHMRLQAEMDWEQQQKADAGNAGLTVPVRLRDGDSCRYCRVIVNFNDRKGKRGGTYDHRHPGTAAHTPEDLVVACRACNSSRKDDPNKLALLPAPDPAFYGNATAAFLATHGHTVTPNEDLRPGTWPDPATSDPAPTGTTQPPPNGRAPFTSESSTRSADPADHLTTGSGIAGTGRVGTGGSSPNPAGTRPGPRKRSRRGRSRTGGTPA
jgi:hypothetical protein